MYRISSALTSFTLYVSYIVCSHLFHILCIVHRLLSPLSPSVYLISSALTSFTFWVSYIVCSHLFHILCILYRLQLFHILCTLHRLLCVSVCALLSAHQLSVYILWLTLSSSIPRGSPMASSQLFHSLCVLYGLFSVIRFLCFFLLWPTLRFFTVCVSPMAYYQLFHSLCVFCRHLSVLQSLCIFYGSPVSRLSTSVYLLWPILSSSTLCVSRARSQLFKTRSWRRRLSHRSVSGKTKTCQQLEVKRYTRQKRSKNTRPREEINLDVTFVS